MADTNANAGAGIQAIDTTPEITSLSDAQPASIAPEVAFDPRPSQWGQ
jgi:hypothetical protein